MDIHASIRQRMADKEEHDAMIEPLEAKITELAAALNQAFMLIEHLADHAYWQTDNAENRADLRDIKQTASRCYVGPLERPS